MVSTITIYFEEKQGEMRIRKEDVNDYQLGRAIAGLQAEFNKIYWENVVSYTKEVKQ